MCRMKAMSHSAHKRRARDWYMAQKPKTLPPRRKRDQLSPAPTQFRVSKRPRACKESSRKELHLPHQQSTQPDCLLLNRLPAELRLQIWEYVVGGQTLHILRKEKKLGHRSCTSPNECKDCYEEVIDGGIVTGRFEPFKADAQLADRSLLPLLLTCRQIYSEAIDSLYTANTFGFGHVWTFDFFKKTVLPKRFESIRSIYLCYELQPNQYEDVDPRSFPPYFFTSYPSPKTNWDSATKALRAMPGLRELQFGVVRTSFRLGNIGGEVRIPNGIVKAFKPLKKLKLRRCTIIMPYPHRGYQVNVGRMEDGLNKMGLKCKVVQTARPY